jgi:hypothetical protein
VSDWNAFARAWGSIGRHAAVDLIQTAACDMCGQRYDVLHDGYGFEETEGVRVDVTQAIDMCGWHVQLAAGRWGIRCGYGSDFDFYEFWYLRNFPAVASGAICDWCIRRMMRDGVIMDSGKRLNEIEEPWPL